MMSKPYRLYVQEGARLHRLHPYQFHKHDNLGAAMSAAQDFWLKQPHRQIVVIDFSQGGHGWIVAHNPPVTNARVM